MLAIAEGEFQQLGRVSLRVFGLQRLLQAQAVLVGQAGSENTDDGAVKPHSSLQKASFLGNAKRHPPVCQALPSGVADVGKQLFKRAVR